MAGEPLAVFAQVGPSIDLLRRCSIRYSNYRRRKNDVSFFPAKKKKKYSEATDYAITLTGSSDCSRPDRMDEAINSTRSAPCRRVGEVGTGTVENGGSERCIFFQPPLRGKHPRGRSKGRYFHSDDIIVWLPSMFNCFFILFCISAAVGGGGAQRHLESNYLYGPDGGSCNLFVSTVPDDNGVAGMGIVFPIQSHAENDDGIIVSTKK